MHLPAVSRAGLIAIVDHLLLEDRLFLQAYVGLLTRTTNEKLLES
jgi:hypothetical protein